MLQSIICVLDSFKKDNDWVHVSLEPDIKAEKVDILWCYSEDKKKAVQVKSSELQINKPNVEKWAKDLENDYECNFYELILIGSCSKWVATAKFSGKTSIKTMNLDIQNLLNNTAFSLGLYLENKGFKPILSGKKLTIVEALITLFEKGSTTGKFFSREYFEDLLNVKLKSVMNIEPLINSTLDLKDNLTKLYTLLFETIHSEIIRSAFISLIEDDIGIGNVSKILKFRYKSEYHESKGEVLSLFNELWRINCQSGLESGNALNALNISNNYNQRFHYGRENQNYQIHEDFKEYFLDKCSKSKIYPRLNDLNLSFDRGSKNKSADKWIQQEIDEIGFNLLFRDISRRNPQLVKYYKRCNRFIEIPIYIKNKGEYTYQNVTPQIQAEGHPGIYFFPKNLTTMPNDWHELINHTENIGGINGVNTQIECDFIEKKKIRKNFLLKGGVFGENLIKFPSFTIKHNDDPIVFNFRILVPETFNGKRVLVKCSFSHQNPGITRDQIFTINIQNANL